jgi:hypothetical protein
VDNGEVKRDDALAASFCLHLPTLARLRRARVVQAQVNEVKNL